MNCGRVNAVVWMRWTESTGRRPVEMLSCSLGSYDPKKPDCGHQCHVLVEKMDDWLVGIVWGGAYWLFVKLKKYFIFLINVLFIPSVFHLNNDSSSKSSVYCYVTAGVLIMCEWTCCTLRICVLNPRLYLKSFFETDAMSLPLVIT